MVLIGYWPLNEKEGNTAYDYSGNDDHCSPQGNPQFGSDGILEQNAMSFGGEDWIESSGDIVNTTRTDPCSIVWWAKLDNSNKQYSYGGFR